MIARAPGKLVLSGAYSVLEGAPAIVAAVDRYAVADGARAADFIADEVRAAVEMGAMPRPVWFDASALRDRGPDGASRKLGLGSSAAILVASLAAALGEGFADDAALRAAILPLALAAHRKAQGGGSGIDVAASVLGGVLRARLAPEGELDLAPAPLPAGAVVEVYASPVAASTRALLGLVRSLADRDPARHRACLDAAGEGARRAAAARSIAELVLAVQAQTDALGALGEAAGAAIVTPEVAKLRAPAETLGGTFAPSGAGGGDIAFYLGPEATTAAFRALATAHGLTRVALAVGAAGAGRIPPGAR